ncbi:hypothetical protein LZ30DRAFT_688958 [Colletotrichum cereale]|nr:hypothetical protein LZ30DRAFT_688958 [Colletotrichum cereale]
MPTQDLFSTVYSSAPLRASVVEPASPSLADGSAVGPYLHCLPGEKSATVTTCTTTPRAACLFRCSLRVSSETEFSVGVPSITDQCKVSRRYLSSPTPAGAKRVRARGPRVTFAPWSVTSIYLSARAVANAYAWLGKEATPHLAASSALGDSGLQLSPPIVVAPLCSAQTKFLVYERAGLIYGLTVR